MAEITAAMVKVLREKTDAPMMECKKALTEAAGDMDKAEEILRVKLGSKASKAAARATTEGLVGIYINDSSKLGTIVEVNCETDFVAKNEQFQDFVGNVTDVALGLDSDDVEALAAAAHPAGGTIGEVLTNNIATIGENQALRRMKTVSVSNGLVVPYVHNAVTPKMGKIGVLVALESTAGADVLEPLGKQIAMHKIGRAHV